MQTEPTIEPYFVVYQIGLQSYTDTVYAESQTLAYDAQVAFPQGIVDYALINIHRAFK